jgi:hypothetical protein
MGMTLLAASDGDIDTSDNLMMIGAFSKAVILNGPNLKVMDPVNTKIVTANVGANPPDFQTVLMGGTSGAAMVVDYVTSLAGACTIYGLNTTEDMFESGETVTGTDNDGNAISFTLSANEVTPTADGTIPPNWYDFTVFGNSATFGSLPSKLYIGAMYLGRLYLAGNPASSHQWYASRQGCIFDYLYDQEDVQSAATGGDVEFGQLQDTVRALVQCGNDYLLFGCHSSIYAMSGDPLQGGSMKQVSQDIGIFGNRSFCFDDDSNLYFFGTGGIYRVLKDLSGVENITSLRLPDLVHDEEVDPSTHRITMVYDTRRHGILITITNLLTKANSCFWYEKRADAFFPESYPVSCAPYSMVYYNSATVADRDLLIGCADGYIRRFDKDKTSDDVGIADTAIDSYVTLGPIVLGDAPGSDGTIGNIQAILAENQDIDSSSVTYYIYVADSPEAVMKKVTADTYSVTGTLTAPGFKRGGKQRRKIRGKYAAIRLRNNSADQTWAFEEIEVEVNPVGRLA